MTRSLLETLLETDCVSIAFQPIVHVGDDGPRLYALECLARGPQGSPLESAGLMFDYARRHDAEPVVDRMCIRVALAEAAALPKVRLSLNVHASTLSSDRQFASFLVEHCRANGIDVGRTTIEVVEHAPPHDSVAFRDAVAEIRAAGARVALDDIGLGFSNYKMLVETRADYFKIDRYFVQSIQEDKYRFAVMESVAFLAERVGARVVAEGVESAADLEYVQRAGVNLIQGYYFSPPLGAAALRAHPLLVRLDSGRAASEWPQGTLRMT